MVALLADPTCAPVPAGLLPWQVRAVTRSAELAVTRGLQLIARGVVAVATHRAPVFIVSSGSGGAPHFVWSDGRRIHCDCRARTERHALTCSHAQFVRLLIVAERAAAFVAPAGLAGDEPAPEPAPVASVAPEPEPEPPTPSGPRCPTCRGPIDPTELAELDECLSCVLMRADYERADREEKHAAASVEESPIPCWACGSVPASEQRGGIYCATCARLPEKERKARASARQKELARQHRAERTEREYQRDYAPRNKGAGPIAEPAELPAIARKATDPDSGRATTAARIIARAKANAGTPSEASPRYARRARQVSEQSAER